MNKTARKLIVPTIIISAAAISILLFWALYAYGSPGIKAELGLKGTMLWPVWQQLAVITAISEVSIPALVLLIKRENRRV